MDAIKPVTSVVGGILGANAASGDAAKSRDAASIATNILQQLREAPDESKAVIWNQYKQAGILTPEMEQSIIAQNPEIAKYKDQADVVQAQRDALKTIGDRARGGLNAEDRYALQQASSQAQTDEEAKRQQILQNMQARGQAGGGAELAAQLAASQSGAQNEATNRARVMAQAQSAALQAAGQQGALGTQIRGQEFSEAAQKSAAQNELDRFNVANQIAQQQRNVSAQNQAQAGNLNVAQNLQNLNTAQANAEIQREMDARRQKYLDDVNLAKTKAGAYSSQAGYLQGQADKTAQATQGLWTGIGQAVPSAYGAISGLMGKKQSEPTDEWTYG
jgi:hypothetical protein